MSSRGYVRLGAPLGAVLLAVAGCSGGGSGGGEDAGAGADGAVPPDAGIAPPAEPAAPALGACPEGWREVDPGDGIVRCDPWPEGGAPDCGPAQMRVPGQGCAPIGSDCPSGDFAEDLPSGALYVRPGASGGDGSRASPFGTIAAAVEAAGPGTTVALAKGTYDENPLVPRGVTLHGACTTETVLRGASGSELPGVVLLSAAGAGLRHLRVGPAPAFGVVSIGTDTTVESVLVEQTVGAGIWVQDGGELALRRVAVREVAATDRTAAGVAVVAGSAVELERVAIRGVEGTGVSVSRRSTASLADVAIAQTTPAFEGAGGGGFGVAAVGEATVQARRVSVDGAALVGLLAAEGGSAIDAEDVVVRGLSGDASGFGQALAVQTGGRMTLQRAWLAEGRSLGAACLSRGEMTLTDAVVEGFRPSLEGAGGGGVEVADGASLRLERVVLHDNRRAAVLALGEGAQAVVRDVRVTGTREQGDGIGGRGLSVGEGARLEVERAVVQDNRGFGLFAADEGTEVAASDLAILDTGSWASDGQFGRGIEIREGAVGTFDRVHVARSTDLGVLVATAGTRAELTDLSVVQTAGRDGIAQTGRALNVQRGATATVTRGYLRGSHNVGALVAGEGSEATLQDVDITGVAPPPCAGSSCSGGELAVGLGVYQGARVEMSGFRIEDSDGCGVQLAVAAQLSLRDGIVRGHSIGACVQIDDYDLARLRQDVVYEDNDINLDATTLPVPSPAEAGSGV